MLVYAIRNPNNNSVCYARAESFTGFWNLVGQVETEYQRRRDDTPGCKVRARLDPRERVWIALSTPPRMNARASEMSRDADL